MERPVKTSNSDREIDNYLRRFRWALGTLPERDIEEIVAETRSHILDRIDGGASIGAVFEGIGTADEYARRFVREHSTVSAISTRRTDALLSALIVNSHGNPMAIFSVGFIFALWAIVIGFAAVTIMKIFNPATIGLWRGEKMFFLGIIDDPATADELLGIWIFPIAFALVAVAWLVTRRIALYVLSRAADKS
jgi:uncharacterized membrane protein